MLKARQIATDAFREETLAPEHIMAAILAERKTRAAQLLEEMEAPPHAVAAALLPKLSELKSGENLDNWQAFLEGLIDPSKAAALQTREIGIRVPRFSSDYAGADADDLIGVEHEAEAFARFVAAEKIDPPLAVALFGDWGSGKTFLMNKIRNHVDALAAKSKEAKAQEAETAYCKDIVQIDFNAWHYIETNLWASLVEHIFTSLDTWLRDKEGSKERTVEALFKQLETARQADEEAQAELKLAVSAKTEADKNLRRIRKEYEKAALEQKALTVADMWQAVTASFKQHLETDEELKADLEDVQAKLGLPRLTESAEELERTITQARAVAGRSRLVLSSIFSRHRPGGSYAWLVGLMVAVPIGTSFVIGALPETLVTDLGSGVAGMSALLATVSGWVGTAVTKANAALDKLEGADKELQKILTDKDREHRTKVAEAENQVAGLINRVKLAEERLSDAQRRVTEVKQTIRAGTVRARLNAFIRERVAQEDYSKHLSIVSLVRRDFEKLSELMHEGKLHPDEEKRLPKGVEINDLRSFERVILYIDDLDRCPPEKVVDVLQAIHLFLAFRLFVVVVGVDARWVSRSLKEHYPLLLSENVASDLERARQGGVAATGDPKSGATSGESKANGTGGQRHYGMAPPISELSASSHDYLEKIFQVPYWVKPMDEEASKDFVRKLASRDKVDETLDDETATPALATGEPKQASDPDPKPATDSPPEDAEEEQAPSSTGAAQQKDGGDQSGDEGTEAAETTESEPVVHIPFNPEQMSLTQHEIDFMEALAPFVGRSPRRSKRFVNVYRLIKSGLTADEHASFVGEQGEALDYRVVLAQLAIVTGAPISAPTYFDELIRAADEDGITKLTALLDQLKGNVAIGSSVEWPYVEGALETLQEIHEDTMTFRRMRHWARRVMRYSFTTRPR